VSGTILVVEDDSAIRRLLEYTIFAGGYPVQVANNPILALGMLEGIDLVVTDLEMPGRDGFWLIQELRKRSDVPIIVLTASGEDRSEREVLSLGANAFLTKPCSRPQLLEVIRALLPSARAESTDAREV
jgi:DNA-binding response OmpR family regulator